MIGIQNVVARCHQNTHVLDLLFPQDVGRVCMLQKAQLSAGTNGWAFCENNQSALARSKTCSMNFEVEDQSNLFKDGIFRKRLSWNSSCHRNQDWLHWEPCSLSQNRTQLATPVSTRLLVLCTTTSVSRVCDVVAYSSFS